MALNRTDRYAYPSEAVDPAKKDKRYIAQYLRAFHSEYLSNGSARWYNGRDAYKELVDYAMGNQSVDRYRSRKEDAKPSGHSFKEKNIDLNILPVIPDFIRKMQGRLAEAQYEAEAKAVDPAALDAKSDYAFRLRALMLNKDLQAALSPASGLDPEEIPMDDNDLQLKVNLGYKHYAEVAVEKALTNAFQQSDWEQLQSELDFDAITFADYCTRDYIENGQEKIKRIAPDKMFVPPSEYEDYRDIRHCGHLEYLTIGEIRALAGDELNEDDYEQLAKTFRGSGSYPKTGIMDFGKPYDNQKVPVFFGEFLSYNEMVFKKVKDQNGNEGVREKGYGSTRKENTRKGYRCLYEGAIIPETDLAFNCRRAYDQKRNPDNIADCFLTYHPCSPGMRYGQNASMVKSITTVGNQIQRAWIRMNVSIASAIPKGYAYDLDKLENIALGKGGANLSAGEIIEFHEATGRFLYRGRDISGEEINGRSGIQEMENGLPRDISEYMGIIRNGVALIQSITGQNPTAAGQTNPDIGKGVSEIAIDSANHSLYFLHRSRKSFYGRNAKALAIRIYDRLERNGMEASFSIGSGTNTRAETLTVSPQEGKKISGHTFLWSISIKPSVQEWQQFYGAANNALVAGQITLADYTLLVQTDNLKEAWALLSIREKRNRLQAMEKAQADIQANAQAQVQAAQEAEAAKQATLQLEWQLKGQHEQLKGQEARLTQSERYTGEIELERMRGETRVETKVIEGQNMANVKEIEGDNFLDLAEVDHVLGNKTPTRPGY